MDFEDIKFAVIGDCHHTHGGNLNKTRDGRLRFATSPIYFRNANFKEPEILPSMPPDRLQ